MKVIIPLRNVCRPLLLSVGFLISMPLAAEEISPRRIADDVLQEGRLAIDLRQVDGQLVILHFWASWCLPCRAEMYSLSSFHATDYAGLQQQGVHLLTVSNDLRRQDLDHFLAKVPVMFPVYFDPLSRLQDQYGVPALPATVIIDARGRIIDRMLGSQDWEDEAFVRRLLSYALTDKPASMTDVE